MLNNLIHVKLVVYCRHPCMVSKHLVDICHQQFWVSGQSSTFSTYFAYPGLEISLIIWWNLATYRVESLSLRQAHYLISVGYNICRSLLKSALTTFVMIATENTVWPKFRQAAGTFHFPASLSLQLFELMLYFRLRWRLNWFISGNWATFLAICPIISPSPSSMNWLLKTRATQIRFSMHFTSFTLCWLERSHFQNLSKKVSKPKLVVEIAFDNFLCA